MQHFWTSKKSKSKINTFVFCFNKLYLYDLAHNFLHVYFILKNKQLKICPQMLIYSHVL